MRRVLCSALSLALCLSLCSCMKSEEAKAADALIESIGEVTLDSEERIIAADNAVEALDAKKYGQLDQLEILEQAKQTFDELKTVAELENVINEIGEVTLENKGKVYKAKLLYGKANTSVRKIVSNYSKLEEAERKLSDLKVQQVIDKINEIESAGIDKKSAVKKANKLYNELTKNEKEKISNFSILENAKINSEMTVASEEHIKIPTPTLEPIPEPVVPNVSMGEQNALSSAKLYLEVMAFSYSGLIDQLQFDGYTYEEAVYGADNCGANWSAQAGAKAWEYLNVLSFSREGLIDQLMFDGFTREQAEFGVSQAGY